MPGLNRRGPNGDGPMTGRRMGRCNPDNKGRTDEEIMQNRNPGNFETTRGFGWGVGRGRGRGLGLGRGRFRGNA